MDSYITDKVKCEFIAKFEGVRQLRGSRCGDKFKAGFNGHKVACMFCSSTLCRTIPTTQTQRFARQRRYTAAITPSSPRCATPLLLSAATERPGCRCAVRFVQHPDRELCDWNIQSIFSYL